MLELKIKIEATEQGIAFTFPIPDLSAAPHEVWGQGFAFGILRQAATGNSRLLMTVDTARPPALAAGGASSASPLPQSLAVARRRKRRRAGARPSRSEGGAA